jgi:hypothetical protein
VSTGDLDAAVVRARDLIGFADGLEDGGQVDTARRIRVVASDLIEVAEQLRDERSARQAAEASYKRALNVIGKRADEALTEALRRAEGRA